MTQNTVLTPLMEDHKKELEWAQEIAKKVEGALGQLADLHMAKSKVEEATNDAIQAVAQEMMRMLQRDSQMTGEQISQRPELKKEKEEAKPGASEKVGRVRRLKSGKEANKRPDKKYEMTAKAGIQVVVEVQKILYSVYMVDHKSA